jgi:hypothetical protein
MHAACRALTHQFTGSPGPFPLVLVQTDVLGLLFSNTRSEKAPQRWNTGGVFLYADV